MTAARRLSVVDVTADDFWDRPRTAAELRARLLAALLDECRPTRSFPRSPADILFLVDQFVAQAVREDRAQRTTTP